MHSHRLLDGAGGRRTAARKGRCGNFFGETSKRLDKATHPDVAGKMRMGGIDSFAELLTRALVFQETLAPIKQAFIDLGASADVDDELSDLITALRAAGNRKS